MPFKILIIDDEEKLRSLLARIIALEGMEVIQAGNFKAGLKKMETEEIDVVICDVKLPDGVGIDLAKIIKERYPATEIILLTAYGNIPDSVQAIKNGAFDYITKGDDNNKIIPLIYKAIDKVSLAKKILRLEKQLGNKYSFDNILGKSKSLKEVLASAKKVAATDASVFLTGETGTGKEVFAQAIHNAGARCKANFIAVNCSAFSKDLLDNELFGHKSGAFTGAIKDSKGIFEEADHGTVFLDEIGEMPLELQAKLLRVLETGEFSKIGESKPMKVNIRLITATNRDLEVEIKNGNFRQDLYYRISVFQIMLPSLNDRLNDVEELALYFVRHYADKTNKKISSLSDHYLKVLKQHSWKGNVRELKNVIERSVILSDTQQLEVNSLPPEFLHPENLNSGKAQLSAFHLAGAEKIHIQKVMNYTNGNKAEAARLLDIAVTTLYRKLDDYNIT